MGILRNYILRILHEESHTTYTMDLPTEIYSAIDTFVLMHNTQVAESDSEFIDRDGVIETALHHFLNKHMWIYGKAPKQEKVQEQVHSPKVVDFRDTKRPEIHFTTGKSQMR